MLEILLLGQPEARYNGEPLAITRRIVRHLLVYLACSPGRVGRSELASLFWPEETGLAANSHLRDILRRLREQLPEKDSLQKYSTQVGFDPEKTYVDVRDFTSKVAAIKRSLQFWPSYKPVPAPTLALMQEAVRLWRSPRFLYGIDLPPEGDYAEWVIKMGQQLEMDRQYLLGKLAENALVYSNPMQAMEWIQLALKTDELNPDLNFHLVETLIEMDRLPEASMHIRFLRNLHEKQGLGDLPTALERINHRMQHLEIGKAHESILTNMDSYLETPFVGQEAVLQELDQVFLHGQGVLITGPQGSGKTRLLYELENRYSPGWRFMNIRTKAVEKGQAYSNIAEMLRQSVRKEEWRKLKAEYRCELAAILPELSLQFPDDPVVSEKMFDLRSNAVNEALYQLLLICSANSRVIITMDNAHWYDAYSMSTMQFLAQRAFFEKMAGWSFPAAVKPILKPVSGCSMSCARLWTWLRSQWRPLTARILGI